VVTTLQSESSKYASDAGCPSRLIAKTTEASIVHRLFRSEQEAISAAQIAMVYIVCVFFTFVPMLLVAALEPYPLLAISRAVKLPFLLDLNITFTFLISFPMLVILMLTDDHVLSTSLERVQKERVINITPEQAALLARTWHAKFRRANTVSQIVGLSVGVLSGVSILLAYMSSSAGTWIVPDTRLHAVSYVYLLSIVLLIAVIVMFVWRCVYISLFLSAIVDDADVVVQPFHPDGCGGLRPVGEIGLRNQYTVTILGLNVVIFALVSYTHSQRSVDELYMMGIAVLAYLVLGPVVFLGPLLPFHRAMSREKQRAMDEVAERLRVEFIRIRAQIPAGTITRMDESSINRLRRIGDAVTALPVWPFDARTLRKFASAYAIPVGAALLGQIIHRLTGVAIPLP
jgi:hypothetical protein